MKRISDQNIEKKFEGTFTSSVVDKVGDRLAEKEIRKIKRGIENNPERRKLTIDHSDRVVGEILDVCIDKNEDGILELNGCVGVYEGNDDVIERMEDGDLSAFSIEAHYFKNTDREEWTDADQLLRVEVDGEHRGGIDPKLSAQELKFKTEIEKSATGLAVFTILVENIHNIAIAIVVLHSYFKQGEEESEKGKPEKVELPNGDEIDIDQDIDDLLKDVEESIEEEIEVDYESLSRDEIEERLLEK